MPVLRAEEGVSNFLTQRKYVTQFSVAKRASGYRLAVWDRLTVSSYYLTRKDYVSLDDQEQEYEKFIICFLSIQT